MARNPIQGVGRGSWHRAHPASTTEMVSLVELFAKFPDDATPKGGSRNSAGERLAILQLSPCVVRPRSSGRQASALRAAADAARLVMHRIGLLGSRTCGRSAVRIARSSSAYFAKAWSDSPGGMLGPVGERLSRLNGRGAVGKAIVVGAKDRKTNHVSAAVVGNTDAKTLQGFVGDHAAEGAKSTQTTTADIMECRSSTKP